MMTINRALLLVLPGVLLAAGVGFAYPLDGYPYTGIARLDFYQRAQKGEVQGRRLPDGAELPMEYVQPRLPGDEHAFEFEPDAGYGRQLARILGEEADRYSIVLLDLSDPDKPLYAEHAGDWRSNVGSVGKIVVALAFFQALADAHPDDTEARHRVLRETWVTAEDLVLGDHHKVVFWDPETRDFEFRPLRPGDRGRLYEWLDWMLSASSNAAASTVQKQLVLLARFGAEYPVSAEREREFLEQNGYQARGEIYQAATSRALAANGLDESRLRQGSMFTGTGKRWMAGTSSYGNPSELAHFLYRMEQGRLVDEYSSRELKRLLYMTQRRIRYASHPALDPYAVYFKSGSLYTCRPEPGFVCRKYQGNKQNLLASLALVEGPGDGLEYHYLVAVVSNVLYVNSAVAHQTLALRIHRMIEARHGPRPDRATPTGAAPAPDKREAEGTGDEFPPGR